MFYFYFWFKSSLSSLKARRHFAQKHISQMHILSNWISCLFGQYVPACPDILLNSGNRSISMENIANKYLLYRRQNCIFSYSLCLAMCSRELPGWFTPSPSGSESGSKSVSQIQKVKVKLRSCWTVFIFIHSGLQKVWLFHRQFLGLSCSKGGFGVNPPCLQKVKVSQRLFLG